MSTKLWEDTVVTIIRDEKWLHAQRTNGPPPLLQLKMKGNAEQRLGDFLDQVQDDNNQDRFFLIEVKGTRDDIKAEWNTKNADKNHQKDALTAIQRWLGRRNNRNEFDLLSLSLRGHLFAYWIDYPVDPDLDVTNPIEENLKPFLCKKGCVVVEPYALACAALRGKYKDEFKAASSYLKSFSLAYNSKSRWMTTAQHIPISLLYEGRAHLLEIDNTSPVKTASTWPPLGLTLPEMHRYVQSLCSEFGANQEPIHAVIMSASGAFFRVTATTAELQQLLQPTPQAPQQPAIKVGPTLLAIDKEEKGAWRTLIVANPAKATVEGANEAIQQIRAKRARGRRVHPR